ncbi:hypothetical protein RCZ04_11950 [Capnocytophaga sp. HP1101]
MRVAQTINLEIIKCKHKLNIKIVKQESAVSVRLIADFFCIEDESRITFKQNKGVYNSFRERVCSCRRAF